MKILKPLSLSLMHKPYRFRGQDRLCITALAFFRLGESAIGKEGDERFLIENLQWARISPLLAAGQPIDLVMPKHNAEIVVSGKAYAPDGKPVEAMCVRLQVGSIDKQLRVVGDREWHSGPMSMLCIDPPKPFTSMPMGYERAFGGVEHPLNPIGRGYAPNLSLLRTQRGPMPNIEYAAQPVCSTRAALTPANFGPMSLMHSPRRQACGSFDQKWLSNDFPGLPDDFEWSVYNLAPDDQQLSEKFQGNEHYRLEGMHPECPVIEGSLPARRVRAFVLNKDDVPTQAREVAMACDSLHFFPEEMLGLMIYRGQAVVSDSDALDVKAVMLGYEAVNAAPRPESHYHEVMGLRLNRQTAGLHAFNDSQLTPVRSPELLAKRAAARQSYEQTDVAKRQAVLDEMMADFWKKSGMTPPVDYQTPRADPTPAGSLSPQDIEELDFDLSELNAQALTLGEQVKAEGEARLAAAQLSIQTAFPAVEDDDAIKARQAAADSQAAIARAQQVAHDLIAGDTGFDPQTESMNAALIQAEALAQDLSLDADQLQKARDAIANMAALRRQGRQAAPTATMPPSPLSSETAMTLGKMALDWYRSGISLAGRDLAGADLRLADFSGADLREIQLEKADLRGANFTNANLSKAVLTGALLDDANFTGALLDNANLSTSSAIGACFIGASLCHAQALEAVWQYADFSGAQLDDLVALKIDLTGACLNDARLSRAALLEAKADGSSWRGTVWSMTVAIGAQFNLADFSGANMTRSVLMDASLRGSQWQGATLRNIYAGGSADWTGAVLTGAHADTCSWRTAKLTGADLSKAAMTQCDFSSADLRGAQMQGGIYYRSLFTLSDLRGVQGYGAEFFQALCHKADFRDADLRTSNLVQASLSGAQLAGAQMDAASMNQTAKLS